MSVAIAPGSNPTPAPHIGCPNCRQKDARIAELSRKLNDYQAQEERRKKYDRIPNQTLSAKAARFAVSVESLDRQWRAEGRKGPQTVNVDELSSELGFSKGAGRAALDELEAVGHSQISYGDPFEIKTKDGRTLEIKPIRVEVLGRDPEELKRTPCGHGGRRCENCGADAGVKLQITTETSMIRRTKRTTTVHCKGCGQHLSTSTTHDDELVSAPKTHTENDAVTPNDTENQIETSSDGGGSPNSIQLGTKGLNHSQHIDTPVVATSTESQIESSSPTESPVDLLCSLAGDDETHIEMQRTGPKYTTVPGPVTPELVQRHLQGDVMLGSTLRHAGGKTRMLRWEADTPADARWLRAAAATLAASGARPLLEDSPSTHHPGGLHLMLIFDGLVHAGSARATAEHHAPALRDVKEKWPNGAARVRLPAGRYRHGSVDAWCALWPVGGLKSSESAALELLQSHQTPATWVSVAPEPPPAPRPRSTAPPARGWLRPTRPLLHGQRDRELTRYAAAMRTKHGMNEDEIVDELRCIVAECCQNVPEDPIREADLISKARSAVRKFRGGSGSHAGADS
jgi:hypothetical protein